MTKINGLLPLHTTLKYQINVIYDSMINILFELEAIGGR